VTFPTALTGSRTAAAIFAEVERGKAIQGDDHGGRHESAIGSRDPNARAIVRPSPEASRVSPLSSSINRPFFLALSLTLARSLRYSRASRALTQSQLAAHSSGELFTARTICVTRIA